MLHYKNKEVFDALKAFIPTVTLPLSAGLADDGFVDPHGVLDLTDYGAGETFAEAWRWAKRVYGGRNLEYAAFNIAAAVAKLMTPVIRRLNPTFVDLVVFNVGRGGEGKSSLVRYVITPLLGGEAALETYLIRLDGPVKSEAQLRNLVDMNRKPLILDEQSRKALVANTPILLSAAVGFSTIAVHASRHGHGIGARFESQRGLVVLTNVPLTAYLREAMADASDYALMRRFVEIRWEFTSPDTKALAERPRVKPALGFAVRLWLKYRDVLSRASDPLELVEKLADILPRECPNDAEVAEFASVVRKVCSELREEKRAERISLSDAYTLVANAYRFATEELKTTQLTSLKVLRCLLENPHKAGLAFTRLRQVDYQEAKETAGRIEQILSRIKRMYTVGYDRSGAPLYTDDASVVVNAVERLVEEKRFLVVLFAKSPLVPGAPREFLGARNSVYVNPLTGIRERGYAVPLERFLALFLDA